MAYIVQYDDNDNVVNAMPSAPTGRYLDENGNPLPNTLINPDVSGLSGDYYEWKINNGSLRMKTRAERDAEKAAAEAAEDAEIDAGVFDPVLMAQAIYNKSNALARESYKQEYRRIRRG